MKKYLLGLAVIILCVVCVVLLQKGCSSEVSRESILPKAGQPQTNTKIQQVQPPFDTPNTILLSNGVMVVDTREKIMPSSPDYEPYMRERQKAFAEGADAKVTLHVVDQSGNDVTNADVMVIFAFHSRNKPISGKTNEKGLFSAEGRLAEEIIYTVEKKNYYKTDTKFWIMDTYRRCLQNGRWIPWNPTLEVTLKEMRHPIPMVAKKAKIMIPKKNQPFGFDFEVGDLVEPHGKGKQADVVLMSHGDKPFPLTYNYSETLVIKSNDSVGGFMRKKKDDWSILLSENEAPQDGYRSGLTFFTTSKEGTPVVEDNLKENEYLLFRTRVVTDENGNIKSAHYGKIYGPLTHGINSNDREGAGATITYYFNPTPNDRNLEFDGKNNLLKNSTTRERTYKP